MSSIAVFPCSFTPAAGLPDELAKTLSLKTYTDKDLFKDVEARTGTPAGNLEKMMYGKTSVFNRFTLERELAVNKMRAALVEVLDTQDNYMFDGFLTSLIPDSITHILKILIADRKESRVRSAEESGMSAKDASKAIRRHDVIAYSWTDFLFRQEAYDPSLYDIVIPAHAMNLKDLTGKIVEQYRKTSLLRSPESQAAVRNMRLETAVEEVLLKNGYKTMISADEGNIGIQVHEKVMNFGKLTSELTRLVEGVSGVESVEVTLSPDYSDMIYRRQKFELPSKVLFVDDEKEFVQTVSRRLISRDVGTYGVYSGEDALDLMTEDSPDVMVLDLKMPGLNGVEVLRRTKEMAPDVEVIILTGHGTSEDMRECMELGAFAYLNKPVDIEELSETIRSANEKKRSVAAA